MVDEALKKRRDEIVALHTRCEEMGDVEGAISTFAPGRVSYDIPSKGPELGEDEVRSHLSSFLGAMTDLKVDTLYYHHADNAVITEVEIHFTHSGEFDGIPPSGRRISTRMCSIFRFDGDLLWQEASYRDNESIAKQLRGE